MLTEGRRARPLVPLAELLRCWNLTSLRGRVMLGGACWDEVRRRELRRKARMGAHEGVREGAGRVYAMSPDLWYVKSSGRRTSIVRQDVTAERTKQRQACM
jgi:hypothetical protein